MARDCFGRRRVARAFTLIELLVVIAVIAILAAILFPVFAQARDKARATQCLSGLKNFGTAFMMYAQDYDETMVPCWSSGTGGFVLGFVDLADPYLRSKDIWFCPNEYKTWTRSYLPAGEGPMKRTLQYSYGCNVAARPLRAMAPNSGLPIASYADVSDTILIVESLDNDLECMTTCDCVGGSPDFFCPLRRNGAFEERGRIRLRHAGGSNYLFADSHAKWQRESRCHQWTPEADDDATCLRQQVKS